MKVAIIGTGIAGNTLAYHLNKSHDITVFEANNYIGGHTHTHQVDIQNKTYTVDTGFIVFNDRTYPAFNALLETLNVPWQPSSMSFSVKDELTGLEYNGTTLNSLFAQRRNLFSPKFYRMVRDILRFNQSALELLEEGTEITLGEYLKQGRYSPQFINQYIIPMGAAIWSTDATQMMQFPARFFIRFFHHHGMLTVNNRPEWRTIQGGSSAYVSKLTATFKNKIQCNTPIVKVARTDQKVNLTTALGDTQAFDYVFFACHSDEALKILGSAATQQERAVLSAIPYQDNSIYLHTDTALMPKRKLAWAAWNYHVTNKPSNKVLVTYNMNTLQNINCPETLLVTLNHTENIHPDKVIKKLNYKHPVYTVASTEAQKQHAHISGHNRTAFAGAYWANGFHEDGVQSALSALKHFQNDTQHHAS